VPGLQTTFQSLRPGAPTLEAALQLPDGDGPFPGAVVCHPHPSGGGSMHVFLVVSIAKELAKSGIAAILFNFCGVGESGGAFTDGKSEPEDVLGALEFLSSREDIDASRLGLTGWSFGAWMALAALAEGAPVRSVVSVAAPVGMYDSNAIVDGIRASSARRHYVLGERDQFCSVDDLEQFAESISPTEAGSIHILRKADHFLFTREAEVATLVTQLLSKDLLKI